MKVLHISTFDRFGAATGCIRLHQALLEEGIDSHLLTLHKTRRDLKNHYAYAELAEKKQIFADFSLSALREKKENTVLRRMKIWAKKKNLYLSGVSSKYSQITTFDLFRLADVVNLHWVAGFLDWRTFWKATSENKPVVWRLSDENPFSGAWHYKDESALADISLSQKNEFQRFEKYCLEVKKKIFNRHSITLQVVTPSLWLNKMAKESALFDGMKVDVIPSSVNTKVFCIENRVEVRCKLGLSDELPTFAFISSELGDYRKGYDLLHEAFQCYKGKKIQFITIGSSREEREISNPKVIHRHFHQVKDSGVLCSLYNAADWVLIPSRQDNLPNVFLEALACGTPVLANPVGGIEDFLPDNRLGVLVKQGKWLDAITEAAEYLNSSRNDIRNFAVEYFSPEVQAKKYMVLYGQLLVA